MITLLYIVGAVFGTILLLILLIYLLCFIPLRKKEDGFEYVHVNHDGTVRELSRKEQGYLREKFAPTDGARPYTKCRYKGKGYDGKIEGFIPRVRVPKRIAIITPKLNAETWRRKWLFTIKDLTNLKYQKRTWLDSYNTNPYYSFIEFRDSYFIDLDLLDGYEKHIHSSFITKKEYELVADWHKLFFEYKVPNNNDLDNEAILIDKKWLKIIGLGIKSIASLKPNLSKVERSFLV